MFILAVTGEHLRHVPVPATELADGSALVQGKKEGPYLCTGYHVYISEEPCPMYVA